MKVMLINSLPEGGAAATSDWDTAQEDIGAFPPIGLSYIAGYIVARTSHDVKIVDAVAEKIGYEEIEKRILDYKPDIVGSTIFTPTFYGNLVLAKLVKKILPECYVCFGGIKHLQMFLNETLSHPEVDFVVRGEGEEIFANLLEALENGTPLDKVNGLSFMDNGKVVSPGPDGYLKEVNDFPRPAFDVMPLHLYKNRIGSGSMVGTIATSRGCPYDCTFCDRPYRTFREYTVERVMSEVDLFYQKGVREFVFFDDMFNINPKRVLSVSDALEIQFKDIKWSFRGRADRITEEMVKRIKKSGCNQIMFGLEATTNEDLREIKKKITVEKFKEGVSLCKKAGIKTSGNFIIGFPTHKTREDVLQVSRFSIECGIDYAQFNILLPYQGTEIYNEGVRRKILPSDFWSNYVKDPQKNAYIPIWEEHLSREELSKLLKMCYQKFYLTPSKAIARVTEIRSLSELKMKILGFLTIIGLGGYQRENQK
ncbi:MAG: B12-binding domain-containing radical SAM protein [Candidatus Zixiibacteriota bacterium]